MAIHFVTDNILYIKNSLPFAWNAQSTQCSLLIKVWFHLALKFVHLMLSNATCTS